MVAHLWILFCGLTQKASVEVYYVIIIIIILLLFVYVKFIH